MHRRYHYHSLALLRGRGGGSQNRRRGSETKKTKTSVVSIAHILSTYLCLFIIILYLYIWVQPASHHLYTNLHIKLRRIAHLLQNPAHHLHILIPVKAPAHERVICSGCVINLAFFAVRHKCRTLHAPQCRERRPRRSAHYPM